MTKPDEDRFTELNALLSQFAKDVDETHSIACSDRDEKQSRLFTARLSKLDNIFEKFTSALAEATSLAAKLNYKDEENRLAELSGHVRSLYYEILTEEVINTSSQTVASAPNAHSSANPVQSYQMRIKLPTIQLPTFDGDIAKWISFKDTYSSLIHDNVELNSIQKFHYLKSSLKSVALQAIASIPIQEDTYTQAWESLCRKFDNPRIQANHYLMKILNFKPITRANEASLNNFSEVFMESAISFRNLCLEDADGFILYTLGLRCLDYKTRERFESECAKDAKKNLALSETSNGDAPTSEIPTFSDFADFIHRQCQQHQAEMLVSKSEQPSNAFKPAQRQKQTVLVASNSTSSAQKCPLCHKPHKLYACFDFKEKSPSERQKIVAQNRLCFNCLTPAHSASSCLSSRRCEHCQKRHHYLLHQSINPTMTSKNQTENGTAQNAEPRKSDSSKPSGSHMLKSTEKEKDLVVNSAFDGDVSVLLGTAQVKLKGCNNSFMKIRVLVDSGSQRSFITSSLFNKLGLKKEINSQILKGFSDSVIQGGKFQASCTLQSIYDGYEELKTSAIIVNRITNRLPLSPIPKRIVDKFLNLKLADPEFYVPKDVDFLLGADLFPKILTDQGTLNEEGYPSALHTIFGWLILGPYANEIPSNHGLSFHVHAESESLENLVRKFWEVESVSKVDIQYTEEEARCEEHFKRTHKRDETGRYVVRLPFSATPPPDLSDSKNLALKRFRNLENKLEKNIDLKEEYSKILKEHEGLNYISQSDNAGKYFLPHHCVVRKSAVSTKVRIVFDGSSAGKNGSLNSHLLTGPKLQLDIRTVLLRFRKFIIAFTSDITQMYLQIKVHPEDTSFQHFFYRFHPSDAIQEYVINRVTFGLSSSPYLAIRVLRQLVEDEGLEFSNASEIILKNTYVDDVLAGAASEEEAIEAQTQLIQLLKRGGFELKKWTSNSDRLLKILPNPQEKTVLPSENSSVKILGLEWDHKRDILSFDIRNLKIVFTKRGILSAIARMYDPLGYLAPVLFKAKIILQNLWKLKLDWDDPLDNDSEAVCKEFFENLPVLSKLSIPRCIFPGKPKSIKLVGFADASSLGYAAVVYLRIEFENQEIKSSLLISKTRLAPLKTMSIPRLELCGALLLVQTLETIQPFLSEINIEETYLFSDSTIVLAWLKLPPCKLKTFVANRVVYITDAYPSSCWHHVDSVHNSADAATRGVSPLPFCEFDQWWYGPQWLTLPIESWPLSSKSKPHPKEIPDLKSEDTIMIRQATTTEPLIDLEKFSSFTKLTRVVAYVGRFISNLKLKSKKNSIRTGPLSLLEIREATRNLIIMDQKAHFSSKSFKENTGLKRLNPFFDKEGLARVGGRLSKSEDLSFDEKHPILLSRYSHLTSLVVDHFHLAYLHAGPRLLQSLLARKFYIVSGRRLIRKRTHLCLRCHRFRAKPFENLMANLPSSRLSMGVVFRNVGIDYAGPFSVKESLMRRSIIHKSYLCLFVCLSTKAVHLEIVSNLTTENFLAALERFIARRGLPEVFLSDNGSNFLGASREIKELYEWLNHQSTSAKIESNLTKKGIRWEFNPPLAPHFGGVWEAGVKSFKFHLKRVVGTNVLSLEEFSTLTTKIEAVLNSRPLYEMSAVDPEGYEVLTPGHFLIGRPLVSLPEPDVTHVPENRLKRWLRITKYVQDVWKKWRSDYLQSLQKRTKWTSESKQIKKNTLVLLTDPNSPPLSWPVGRILEVYPGPDGRVRVVKIRTSRGEYIRPITKLAPLLPCETE